MKTTDKIRRGDLISIEKNRFYSKEIWSFKHTEFDVVIYTVLGFEFICLR